MFRITNGADRIRGCGFFKSNQVLGMPVADNPSSRLDGSSPDTGAMLRPPQSKLRSAQEKNKQGRHAQLNPLEDKTLPKLIAHESM
jgi:hypothetical protein